MRLAGRTIMGHYPTPPKVVDLLATWVQVPAPCAVLDPCCGTGAALAQFLSKCGAAPGTAAYGIELDRARAEEARGVLHRVLNADAGYVRVSHEAFGLLWLNPPYDTGEEDGAEAPLPASERLERRFLRQTHPYLVPGGVIVFIIPERELRGDLVRALVHRFQDLRAWRFPDPEYGSYRQAVVLGVKRRVPGVVTAELEAFQAAVEAGLPTLTRSDATAYCVPATSPDVALFRSLFLTAEDVREDVARSAVWDRLRLATSIPDPKEAGQPPMRLKPGLLALLLAAGYLDGPVGQGDERHLIRGLVLKEEDTAEEETTEDEGGGKETRTTTRERYRVRINVLTQDGSLKELI